MGSHALRIHHRGPQYYHAAAVPQYTFSYDSDDETDNRWLVRVNQQQLDEFDDVAIEEKMLMSLWNSFFVLIDTCDRTLPYLTVVFSIMNADKLRQYKLRSNYLVHLLALTDFGLLDVPTIRVCMDVVDGVHNETAERVRQSMARKVPSSFGISSNAKNASAADLPCDTPTIGDSSSRRA